MTITQQQALEALERVYYATHASFIDRNLVRQYIEQSTAQPQAVVPAMNLLEALKSGKAILINWPMEPSTPEEALELMDMMDAEYAKTMGKPAPDDEMAVAMRRVRHMACDLWAWQKEEMRAHFTALAAAQPSAQAERAPVVQAVQAREYPPLPWGNQQPYVWFCRTKDTDLVAAFRAYVDAALKAENEALRTGRLQGVLLK